MSIHWIGPALALTAGTAAVAAGGWLLLRARARYWELLAAVELVQRQLVELRARFEESRERVERIEALLADGVEPRLVGLERHLEVEEVASEVRRAQAADRLAPEVARRLLDHLAALDAEVVAAGRPF